MGIRTTLRPDYDVMSRRATQTLTGGQVLVLAPSSGVIAGVAASFMRLGPSSVNAIGAGIAVWFVIGFLVVRTAPRRRIAAIAGILFLGGWLVAYFDTQIALNNGSATLFVKDALPWFIVLVPGGIVLGLSGIRSRSHGLWGEISLSLPLAIAALEAGHDAGRGFEAATIATLCIGVLPLLTERRRPRTLVLIAAFTAIVFTLWLLNTAGLSPRALIGR